MFVFILDSLSANQTSPRDVYAWGVLPYITYTGYVPPNGVVILKLLIRTGYPFQRHFLERGIIFNKMGKRKNCGSWLYLLLKIVADYEEAVI